MNKKLITIILLISSLQILGQHDLGLKFNGGLSKISNSFASSNSTLTNQFTPSFNVGAYYNLNLSDKFIIGTELLFMQIEGKENLDVKLTDSYGNNVGTANTIFDKHISYLTLPIYFGFKIKNLTFNLGFQSSLVLASSLTETNKIVLNGENINSEHKYEELNINRFDYGPKVGISIDLNKKFSFEGNYYLGINDIVAYDGPSWKWKVQQITLGLKYSLLKINKKKNE